MFPYTNNFYETIRDGTRRSAEAVMPLVTEWIRPRRVVDVGCGVGAWLSAARDLGVEDVLGMDGDYVDRRLLLIPEDRFLAADLNSPPPLEQPFDLVISLEVAEHLPPERAAGFIEYLTGLGPVVLFSAAIPHQTGDGHQNEAWPDYWAALFEQRGFVALDCLRHRFWDNERVEWWYAQNMLLYVKRDHPALRRLTDLSVGGERPLRLVHPRLYLDRQQRVEQTTDPKKMSLKQTLALLPGLAGRAARRVAFDKLRFVVDSTLSVLRRHRPTAVGRTLSEE